MKKKCKDVDLLSYSNLIPALKDAVFRHYKRYDFRNLLGKYGLSEDDYYDYFISKDKALFDEAIENLARECSERVAKRDLKLKPVRISERMDISTGKIRQIGKESAMQQCFDYIAYYGAKQIFENRIVPQQASSIEGRGQIYGVEIIQLWVKKDYDSLRYAERHGLHYSRKCRYLVKLDIRKCYPSADLNIFLKLFEKDCGNEDLYWLWESLLASHRVDGYTGFMIGSLVSQWACQYMLSFAYRFAKDLHFERRGKKIKCVEHMLLFMDDILLIGSNRKQLKSAVRKLIGFCKSELSFDIKDNWFIQDIEHTPIDMMGYVVYSDGHIEIRDRDFIRSRRMFLKYESQGHFLTLKQAQRFMSFKGFFDHSDSVRFRRKNHFREIRKYCSAKIGRNQRRRNAQ